MFMNAYKLFLVIILIIAQSYRCLAAEGSSQILIKAIQAGNDLYISGFAGDQQSVYKVQIGGSGSPKKMPLLKAVEATSEKLVSAFDIKDSHIYYTTCTLWRPSFRHVQMIKFLTDDFNALRSGDAFATFKELKKDTGIIKYPSVDFLPLMRIASALDFNDKQASIHYDFIVLPNDHIKLFTLIDDKMTIAEYEISGWQVGTNVPQQLNSVSLTSPFQGAFQAVSDSDGHSFLVTENGAIHLVNASSVSEVSRLSPSAITNTITRAGIILLKDATNGSVQVIGGASLVSTAPKSKMLHVASIADSPLQSPVVDALKSVLPIISPP